jgi:hypothetical protein
LAVLVLAMIAVSRVEIVLGAGVNEIFLRQIDALGGEFSFLDVGCDGVDGFDCFGFVSSRIKTSGCRMLMDNLQKKADSADAAVSEYAAEVIKFNQPAWKYQERKLEMERYFLQWTEQQRMAMDPGYPTPVEVDRDDRVALSKVVRMASISDRRKRQPKARSVLGEPGISKCKTQKRGGRRQKPKTPDTAPKPARPPVDFTPPTSNGSRIPDSPATKPRRTKTQTPRRQPPPQKLSKAKRFDNATAKSAAASRRRAIGHKRSSDAQSPRRSQPALVEVTTRSGRVSRPPVKWVPA